MLTFGQFYPGKDKKVIIFVFSYFKNPNLLGQDWFSFLEIRGKHFLLTFPISTSFLSPSTQQLSPLTHFLSLDRQFLHTRVKKKHCFISLRRTLDATVIQKSLASLPECLMERSLSQHHFRELGLGCSRTQCLVQYKHYLIPFNLDQAGLVSICSASISTDPGYFQQNHSVV